MLRQGVDIAMIEEPQNNPLQRKCAKPGCDNTADRLQCPQCKAKGDERCLEFSFFCSQPCFKEYYGIHKLLHDAPPTGSTGSPTNPWPSFKYTGDLRPWPTNTPSRTVPSGIERPDYALTGIPHSEQNVRQSSQIPLHSAEEIEKARAASLIARQVLDAAARAIRPGITTLELDEIVHRETIQRGAYPSPLNYRGFPRSCCTSVNEVICHGIPDGRPLVDGDIVNIDVTVYRDGFHGDLNETYLVGGAVDERSKALVQCAYDCLAEAIKEGTGCLITLNNIA